MEREKEHIIAVCLENSIVKSTITGQILQWKNKTKHFLTAFSVITDRPIGGKSDLKYQFSECYLAKD